MKNIISQISKAYNKRVQTLSKNFSTSNNVGLLLFIEHLKQKRDILLIQTVAKTNSTIEQTITSLNIAIAEFEAYQESKELEQKAFHWNTFCEFVKLNMEAWVASNDSI